MSEKKRVFFISDSAGYGILKADGKHKLRFKPMEVFKEQLGRKVNIGFYGTEDENEIEFLRNYPDHGKGFKEVNKLPQTFRGSSVVSGVATQHAKEEQAPTVDISKIREEAIEFGRLQSSVLKKDGTYRGDASEEDIAKYEELKTKLEG